VVCCVRNVPTSSRSGLEVVEVGLSRGGEKICVRQSDDGEVAKIGLDMIVQP